MNAPVKQVKDVIRLQFDVRRAQLNIIESLVETCGLSSKKELFSNAMALMKWAVQETQKGRQIASYDPKRDQIEVVALPALDLIEQPSPSGLKVGKPEDVTQRERDEGSSVGRGPKLGVV